MAPGKPVQTFRGPLLHFLEDPGLDTTPAPGSYDYFEDGLLVEQDGHVEAVGPAEDLLPHLPEGTKLAHWPDHLILPGFIDTHIHLPQLGVMGSYGAQLLDWLEKYTFPAETRFQETSWAQSQAALFLDQLSRHGTTAALVFCTSHPQSVDALFEAAEARGQAITGGKVMMDRNSPDGLRDETVASHRDSQALIDRWHNKGRLQYAVTPRFAPTSTPRQLELAGKLVADNPGVLMQTHWAEHLSEIEWVKELFPDRSDYLDVYAHYGLLNDRAVLAHGIHIDDHDRRRLVDTGARVAFCPTSNTFLGSGLFDLKSAHDAGVTLGLATDVGGGTSLSLLPTMAEAYKVCQLRGQSLTPFQAFYLATLGNARVLHRDNEIGNFAAGKAADFIVLDPTATPVLAMKHEQDRNLFERLFDLMMLGDDRVIQRTYIAGHCRFDRDSHCGSEKRDSKEGVLADGRVSQRMA
ncbi:guanine deaminase [Marinobacter nanhaiticus D15-8W]|uniref:Guanine deaminase n=1 Tax=Marinobacter nanhaiticus D15-8W TaxID=626887 RepID=N6WTN0_9GAMM|nr:guanine deaminase [Marinobacter nanhaiticus D15-8W]